MPGLQEFQKFSCTLNGGLSMCEFSFTQYLSAFYVSVMYQELGFMFKVKGDQEDMLLAFVSFTVNK
jgi:hypothetical protein